jgi:hypothetical protein
MFLCVENSNRLQPTLFYVFIKRFIRLSIHPVLLQFDNNLLQFNKAQLCIDLTCKREGLLLVYVEIL